VSGDAAAVADVPVTGSAAASAGRGATRLLVAERAAHVGALLLPVSGDAAAVADVPVAGSAAAGAERGATPTGLLVAERAAHIGALLLPVSGDAAAVADVPVAGRRPRPAFTIGARWPTGTTGRGRDGREGYGRCLYPIFRVFRVLAKQRVAGASVAKRIGACVAKMTARPRFGRPRTPRRRRQGGGARRGGGCLGSAPGGRGVRAGRGSVGWCVGRRETWGNKKGFLKFWGRLFSEEK
jgi:hypothetical protein